MKTKNLILLFGLFLLSTENVKSQTIIGGEIDNFQSDSIKIVLEINSIIGESETILVPVINGKFKQQINIRKPTFVYTKEGSNYVHGLIEPGDHITILYDANNPVKSLKFTGKGSNKFAFSPHFYNLKISINLRSKPHLQDKRNILLTICLSLLTV